MNSKKIPFVFIDTGAKKKKQNLKEKKNNENTLCLDKILSLLPNFISVSRDKVHMCAFRWHLK